MLQTQELRATGIGGSDAAVIMGLNPYKTPLQLYMEKTGQIEPEEENDAMHFGNILESVIADEYARRTGRKVARVNETLRHEDHEWMMGHIDRRVLNIPDGMLLECKTAGRWFKADDWGQSGTGDAPEHYIVQVQHYLGITGWQYADLAALLAGNDFRIYHFERDNKMINELIKRESEFWESILDRRPPQPQTQDDIKMLYPHDSGETVTANDEIATLAFAYRRIQSEIKELETSADAIKVSIQNFMGEGSVLVNESGEKLAAWKSQERNSFDSASFKKDHADLYNQYQKHQSIRVFR